MLMMRADDGWVPPVLLTVAHEAQGVGAVWAAVTDHRDWLERSGEGERRRRRRVENELRNIVASLLAARAETHGTGADFERWTDEVMRGHVDPWTAAEHLLELPVIPNPR
jgi:LAO/AO transport system kinase